MPKKLTTINLLKATVIASNLERLSKLMELPSKILTHTPNRNLKIDLLTDSTSLVEKNSMKTSL
jgi:hypothetical protein